MFEGDGCGTRQIIGFRFHCSKCANHDVCESCFDSWEGGNGSITNNLAEQKLSTDPADHSFMAYKDKSFKSLVKSTAAAPERKKTKPNEPCTCGSGKKFKKCCADVSVSNHSN